MTAGKFEAAAKAESTPSLVVCVGASAGGLSVFRKLLQALRSDTGMAFVFAQHLDPKQPSVLPELLASQTQMSVRAAVDGMAVEPDHVYVVAPDSLVRFRDGKLRVQRPLPDRERQHVVDRMFESAAECFGRRSVVAVLSGTGRGGLRGLRAARQCGGLVLAQSLEEASHPGMPSQAVQSGLVDRVVTIAQVPALLLAHARQVHGVTPSVEQELAERLPELLEALEVRTGRDFADYKPNTLVRRIARRMRVLGMQSVDEYAQRLRTKPEAAVELVKDLLIGVTEFFRDADAFEVMEDQIVPQLLQERSEQGHVRVWVAGCASGEEAYSLAMLFKEHGDRLDNPPEVQVFATDLDDRALERARRGRYPRAAIEKLGPERTKRFFSKDGNDYLAKSELRDMCIFSQHDLTRDPPFSRLDLVSCRNVLIYLEPRLQKRALELFHYALGPGGYLFLGPAENVSARADLFRSVNQTARVFRRRDTSARIPVDFAVDGRAGQRSSLSGSPANRQALSQVHERLVLDEFAPPSVIIDEAGVIVHYSGRTAPFLQQPMGEPSASLVALARRDLRPDLRAAVHKAVRMRREVVHDNVLCEHPDGLRRVDLVVRPIAELGDDSGLFLVVFQDRGVARRADTPVGDDGAPLANPVIEQLESELKSTKEHLQSTIEELETSNEELKSSNEELLSMNEELQSLNEEFETVNVELKAKVEELDDANSTLANLLRSFRLPTVFFDSQLRLRRFTDEAGDVFRLEAGDVGRPLADLAARFHDPELEDHARAVLTDPRVRERLVWTDDGATCFSVRTLPFETPAGETEGAVVTFSDVTRIERARREAATLAAIVQSAQEAIVGKTLDGTITSWNAAAERMYGYPAAEAIGQNIELIIPPERSGETQSIYQRLARGLPVEPFETVRMAKSGRRLEVLLTISPVIVDGKVVGASAMAQDITAENAAIRGLEDSERRYRVISELISDYGFSYRVNERGHRQLEWITQSFARISGYSVEEVANDEIRQRMMHPEDLERVRAFFDALLTNRPGTVEHRIITKEGRVRLLEMFARPVWDEGEQRVVRFVGAGRDVTEARRDISALRESEERYRSLVAATTAVVWTRDRQGNVTTPQPSWEAYTGQTWQQYKGLGWLGAFHPDDRGQLQTAWQNAAQQQSPYEVRGRLWHAGHRGYRHCQVHAVPVLDDLAQVREWVGTIDDVNEQRLAEQRSAELTRVLEERVSELSTLLAVSPIGIWVAHDPECNVITGNEAGAQMLGIAQNDNASKTSNPGLPFKVLQEGRELPPEEMPMQYAARHGVSVRDVEVDVVRGDGETRRLLEYAAPLFDEAGKVRGSVGLFVDITRRKQMEDALRAAKHDVEQASGAKDQFLAALSHELRTPLTPVLAGAGKLERHPELPSELEPVVQMIQRNVELEARLIDDLLDLTRIARGKLEIVPERVSVRTLLERALEICSRDIDAKNHTVELELGDHDLLVDADPARIQQVFWNLLKNAVKFTPEGGRITVKGSVDSEQHAVVQVEDSGVGIEPELLPKVFDAFEQGSREGRFGGLGLGLAISKALVELHGGTISAESAGKNCGAQFRVELPLAKGAALPAPRARIPSLAGTGEQRILLVEDHADSAEIMCDLLTMFGHTVEVAHTMQQGLEKAKSGDFGLIISDLGLPDGSGHQLIATLREGGVHTPAIALSGYGSEQDRERSRDAGFDDHVMKPVTLKELQAAIARVEARTTPT